jgi:hypothetical protein
MQIASRALVRREQHNPDPESSESLRSFRSKLGTRDAE